LLHLPVTDNSPSRPLRAATPASPPAPRRKLRLTAPRQPPPRSHVVSPWPARSDSRPRADPGPRVAKPRPEPRKAPSSVRRPPSPPPRARLRLPLNALDSAGQAAGQEGAPRRVRPDENSLNHAAGTRPVSDRDAPEPLPPSPPAHPFRRSRNGRDPIVRAPVGIPVHAHGTSSLVPVHPPQVQLRPSLVTRATVTLPHAHVAKLLTAYGTLIGRRPQVPRPITTVAHAAPPPMQTKAVNDLRRRVALVSSHSDNPNLLGLIVPNAKPLRQTRPARDATRRAAPVHGHFEVARRFLIVLGETTMAREAHAPGDTHIDVPLVG